MSTDDLNQIARLFRLRESGALTQAEFEAEKARVLNEQNNARIDGEATASEPVAPVEYTQVAPADEIVYEDHRSYRSRSPLVPIILATILAIVAGVGWYVMRGNTTTVEPDVALNTASPAPAPSSTVAAAPQATAEQSAASLYQWATSIEPLGVTPDYLTSKLGTPAATDQLSILSWLDATSGMRRKAPRSPTSDAEMSPSCKPSLNRLERCECDQPPASHFAGGCRAEGGRPHHRRLSGDVRQRCRPCAVFVHSRATRGQLHQCGGDGRSESVEGTEKWASAIRTAHNLSADDELPAQSFQCGADTQDVALQEVGPVRIGRVLVGQGISTEKPTMCGVDTN
ncbi:SHOCT domain-containing protein [Sphingomonas aerolata]|uniref:SHOCT domain-containing protein n=1 Tax=Sphingomonas aerolata TaxID=185951 RepID=UPI002FE31E79